MIVKNVKWGISENVTVAEFGSGDILVASGSNNERSKVCVMLSKDKPQEIGACHPEFIDKTTDELEYEVIMSFDNVESINIVIDALKNARKKLVLKTKGHEGVSQNDNSSHCVGGNDCFFNQNYCV